MSAALCGGGVIVAISLCATLIACDGPAVPSAEPPSSSAVGFRLLYNPDGFCPLAGGSGVTIVIDPLAGQPVIAITDDGRTLLVRWPPGFVGGTAEDPVVRDASGYVVARNGERLTWPHEGFPNLHGYFVCDGGDALWIVTKTLPRPSS